MRIHLRTLQFDLRYLFIEMLFFAISFGAFRIASSFSDAYWASPLVAAAIISGCTALGGLALRPIAGAVVGLAGC